MSIKFYGKSQETCQAIITQFKTGDLPETLKSIFVNRSDDIPSNKWSWNNQFIKAISGTSDARGFKQWGAAGRKVKKGAKAFHILGPCIAKRKETDEAGNQEEKNFLYGFKSIPVFRLEDTEIYDQKKWEKASSEDQKEKSRLRALPFYEVAEKWGLKVTSFNGKGGKYYGYYSHNGVIALGVENLSTWAHEMIHAADDRLKTIKKVPGQDMENEVVAELGGAVILKMLGYEHEADLGGAWSYIQGYTGKKKETAISVCMRLIDRICNCVNLILTDAEKIREAA